MSRHLLQLAGIGEGQQGRAADLGAGDGVTLQMLKACGYEADGYDINGGDGIMQADLMSLPAEDEAYDLVLSECTLSLCQDQFAALLEAVRITRRGGRILIADIFPCGEEELRKIMQEAGLSVLFAEDQTACWKDYIISRIWQDEYGEDVCRLAGRNSRYYLLGLERK